VGLSIVGFVINLVRLWPSLSSAWQYHEERMAGFLFFVMIGALLAFPILGLVGAVVTGIGLLLGRAGTRSISVDRSPEPTPTRTPEGKGSLGPGTG
jgi:hypothetical protein